MGELLLKDILASLTKPRRDPRDDLTPPVFRRGVLKLDDLKPGMELSGTVLNVVDFGVFVDIGISDSALVHISRLADHFVRDPHQVMSVGDIVRVWVVDVDRQRRRVALTAVAPVSPDEAKTAARQRPGRNRSRSRSDQGRRHRSDLRPLKALLPAQEAKGRLLPGAHRDRHPSRKW